MTHDQLPSDDDTTRAPSLVPVAIIGSLVTIALCVVGWNMRYDYDPNGVRHILLAFGGPAITAFVAAGFARTRGYRKNELRWLIPMLLGIAVVAAAPMAYAAVPTVGSIVVTCIGVGIAFMIGWLTFILIGIPVTILGRAVFARVKPRASHVWWSAAGLIFAAGTVAVFFAIDDVGTGTNKGLSALIWLRILGAPYGEVLSEGALWLARALIAIALVLAYLGARARKRETP